MVIDGGGRLQDRETSICVSPMRLPGGTALGSYYRFLIRPTCSSLRG